MRASENFPSRHLGEMRQTSENYYLLLGGYKHPNTTLCRVREYLTLWRGP